MASDFMLLRDIAQAYKDTGGPLYVRGQPMPTIDMLKDWPQAAIFKARVKKKAELLMQRNGAKAGMDMIREACSVDPEPEQVPEQPK